MNPQPPPSSQAIGVDPSQIPILLSQHQSQLQALSHVLSLKRQVISHLDSMESHVASGDLSKALALFIEIQRIEYQLQIQGFEEKLLQVRAVISQLERLQSSRISVPTGFKPPPIPSSNRY